jgi:hypothetical protein
MRRLAAGLTTAIGLGLATATGATAAASSTTMTLQCGTKTYTVVRQGDNAASWRSVDGTNVLVTAIGNVIGKGREPVTDCILNPGTPDQFGPVPFVITPLG